MAICGFDEFLVDGVSVGGKACEIDSSYFWHLLLLGLLTVYLDLGVWKCCVFDRIRLIYKINFVWKSYCLSNLKFL